MKDRKSGWEDLALAWLVKALRTMGLETVVSCTYC